MQSTRRIAAIAGGQPAAHLDAGVTGRRRARLAGEIETLVRLLAGAYRVISKHLGDSRFSPEGGVSFAGR